MPSNGTMSNELENTQKDAIVAWFEVLFRHLPWGADDNHGNPQSEHSNPGPSEYEAGVLHTRLRRSSLQTVLKGSNRILLQLSNTPVFNIVCQFPFFLSIIHLSRVISLSFADSYLGFLTSAALDGLYLCAYRSLQCYCIMSAIHHNDIKYGSRTTIRLSVWRKWILVEWQHNKPTSNSAVLLSPLPRMSFTS
jgi:hypothetical protein